MRLSASGLKRPRGAVLVGAGLAAWAIALAANAASLTPIASFSATTGDRAYAGVVLDNVVGRASAVYATTTAGDGDCDQNYGCGSVVRLAPPASPGSPWSLQVLHAFSGADGEVPFGSVVIDTFGALYGTATRGGQGSCAGGTGCGVVYRLTPPTRTGGAWRFAVLHVFAGPDGGVPTGSLVFDSFGALYGTTEIGGAHSQGVVFRLAPPATPAGAWIESVLYSFAGPDGARPRANLTFDSDGDLYGTTQVGGVSNLGVVFRLAPPTAADGAWSEAVLHSFLGGADGSQPFAGVSFGARGTLLSTAWMGGTANAGVAFQVTPPAAAGAAWSESVYPFDETHGGELRSGLTPDGFGGFYGVATRGGPGDCSQTHCGVLYRLTPPNGSGAWTYAVLADFTGPNGGDPAGTPALQGGLAYGSAEFGGADDEGVVFAYGP